MRTCPTPYGSGILIPPGMTFHSTSISIMLPLIVPPCLNNTGFDMTMWRENDGTQSLKSKSCALTRHSRGVCGQLVVTFSQEASRSVCTGEYRQFETSASYSTLQQWRSSPQRPQSLDLISHSPRHYATPDFIWW